jgi:hypothetical protein
MLTTFGRKRFLSDTAMPSRVAAMLCLALFLSACATIGRDFPASRVYDIQIGKTTQAEIEGMFGKPWRVGIEDGTPAWTYGRYHYSAFGPAITKDLVVRFDSKLIVRSYQFNTTNPEDLKKQHEDGPREKK